MIFKDKKDEKDKKEKKAIEKDIDDFNEQFSIKQLFNSDNLDDLNPALVLTFGLIHILNRYESKDNIPKGLSKPFAIVSQTNDVQFDLIHEIISKNNDSKGKVKKDYYNLAMMLIKSLRIVEKPDDSRFSFLRRS